MSGARVHRDIAHDKPYRELPPDNQEEIYGRFNQGDIIMVNYPTHEYHKRIGRVRNDGVDSDGDVRVALIIKELDASPVGPKGRDWFYVHFTRAVILRGAAGSGPR